MKYLLTSALAFVFFAAVTAQTTIPAGSPAPAIKLPDVSGKIISTDDYKNAKGFIVVFTCNTCPYAKTYEQRIIDLNNKYASQGYPVIAINPNDPELSSGDSFDEMKERAKEKNYPFPYLFDEGQKVTNAYGARSTPHVFLVQAKNGVNTVIYTGAIDNDPENSSGSKTAYIEQAIQELAADKQLSITTTKAIGCSVKRKRT